MDINVTKISYDLASDGTAIDILVEVGGNDTNGQYISARLIIKTTDLAEGKTLDALTKADIVTIARTKLVTVATTATTTATTTA